MKEIDKNLIETIKNMQINDHNSMQIAREIQAGDELLHQADNIEVPAEVISQVEKVILNTLKTRPGNRLFWRQVASAAAVIAVAILLGTIWLSDNHNNPDAQQQVITTQTESDIFDNEPVLWELALIQEDTDELIDELTLTEVFLFWNDMDQELDDILGKEQSYENYIT